jgi:hypothetical protein
MCIKDYETEIGGQGPVRAVELLEKKKKSDLVNTYWTSLQITMAVSLNYTVQRSL